MKRHVISALLLGLATWLPATTVAEEPVTAEVLANFYPGSLESRAFKEPALSHLEIPGHQLASTTRYYDFGGVEIVYHAVGDPVQQRLVERLKPSRYNITEGESQGFKVLFVYRNNADAPIKAMVQVGEQIHLSVDCGQCASESDLQTLVDAFDLPGFAALSK